MDKKIGLFLGLTAMFVVGSAHAQTCPAQPESSYVPVASGVNPETGHTFDVYYAPGVSWADVKTFVDGLTEERGSPPVKGHLATINSSGENAWIVDKLLQPAIDCNLLDGKTQVWVGGMQAPGQTSVGDGWSWVNNEGSFGGVNGVGVYTNWAVDDAGTTTVVETEPNDSPTLGENDQENHLTLGRFAGNLYGWNDEGSNLPSIGGFIVEYDTPRSVGAGCTAVAGGSTACTTVRGQTISFPPGTFVDGNNFTFTAYEFNDPRVDSIGRCVDRRQLELFTESAFDVPTPGSGTSGKIVIPEYLCGSPRFLVIRAVDNGINVPSGVVTTTNKTLAAESDFGGILPGNFFDCVNPIPADGSPQKQDVGVWQDLNPAKMREFTSDAAYFGSVAELTTACGSTVLKTIRKSNFVVGLHIDFGPDVGYRTQAEYREMLELTQRKVQLLQQSVRAAIAEKRYVKNPDGQAMLSQLDSVYAALLANNLSTARKKIQDFLNKVNTSAYKSGPTLFNYNGDHLSRGENVRFMLDHKLIPFRNSP